MSSPVVILGAGIAGLAAGYVLGPQRSTVYESKDSFGGLCGNFVIDGFRFDTAVHLSFTKSPIVRGLFDQTPYHTLRPDPFNYYYGHWLKHPVQNNLFRLPEDFKSRALADFKARPPRGSGGDPNYSEWLRQTYGEFMAQNLFDQYTRKYWCTEPSDMEIGWIGDRLYQPKLEEVLRGATTDQTPDTYYASEMRYPVHGGYKSFLAPLAEKCGLQLHKKAVSVNPSAKYVIFADGSKTYYETLISSLPLPALVEIIEEVPARVREAAKALRWSSVALTSLGFNRSDIPQSLWFYIYDQDILPARAHSPSRKSKNNVPVGMSSLQFETYYSTDKELPMSLDHLSSHVVESAVRMGVCNVRDILFVDSRILPYGNVIFDLRMRSARAQVREYLGRVDIHSIGRFGEWDYLWSDQSLLSGMKAADKVSGKV